MKSQDLTFHGNPERLDKFLSHHFPGYSRSYLQKLVRDGLVQRNGDAPAPGTLLRNNDTITVSIPDFSNLPPAAGEKIPILFEDDQIIVVNKPPHLVVHPAGSHQKDTLIQRLWPKLAKTWASSIKGKPLHTARPGVVHRLDKGTSGVMVIALTPQAADALSRQFANRQVKKVYWALVHGIPLTKSGHIKSTVGRSRKKPRQMSVADPGRWSETSFRVLNRFVHHGEGGASLLEVSPLTGRTHQIRVQLASLGHPLLGDSIYGAPKGQGPPPPAPRSEPHASSPPFREKNPLDSSPPHGLPKNASRAQPRQK